MTAPILDTMPSEHELEVLELTARMEEMRFQLAFVRAERDRAREQLSALADEVDGWIERAKRAKTAMWPEQRALEASVLINDMTARPVVPCSTCDGGGRVDIGFGDTARCPDCSEEVEP